MAGRKLKNPGVILEAETTTPKRRGRPPGSNKPKDNKPEKKAEKKPARKPRQTIKDKPGRLSSRPGVPQETCKLEREIRSQETQAAHEKHLAALKEEIGTGRKKNLSQKKLAGGLTYNQMLFVEAYCRDPNGNTLEMLLSAGYKPSSAQSAYVIYQQLLSKPEVTAAINEKMLAWRDLLDGKSREFVSKVMDLATYDVLDICSVEDGRLKVKDTKDMPWAARNMVESIKFKPGEFGDEWSVSTRDRKYYFETVLKWLSLSDRAAQAKASVHPQQRQAILDVRNGIKTPVEAALDLEAEGIPVPETIKTLLARPEIAVAVKQDVTLDIPTPEEIAARRRKLLEEVKDQKESFLPARREEIRELKSGLGAANSAFDVTPE